ncbi:F-box domain-containing protein [Favolaschia claudopus]|uniref:F-box domain-containing protein n=1 Tax=Favolaschia claudopus TaxID=2862362 RepID=A0AAW0CBS7_9AGAR
MSEGQANHDPALQLPFELISSIFVLCLPLRRRVRPRLNRAPLNLASVCRDWRAVTMGTPELWTAIFLQSSQLKLSDAAQDPIDSRLDTRNHCADLMDLWFTRASGRPLSISLNCPQRTCLPSGLLDVMATYHIHWARIELAISSDDFLSFNEITGPFPLLSTLCIKIVDAQPEELTRLHVNSIRNSPNLRYLELPTHTRGPHNEDLALFPRNLTSACFILSPGDWGPVAGGSLAPILNHFPHILHLDLHLFQIQLPIGAPPERLEAYLITLRLNLDHALDLLSLPALQSLHIELSSIAKLSDFLAQSQCHLTTLSVEMHDLIQRVNLVGALSAAPELHTLIVAVRVSFRYTAIQYCDDLFDINLVPRLRNLIVEERARFPAYDRWTELLQLRAGAGLVFAELYVHPFLPVSDPEQHSLPPSHDVQAQWAVLVAGGMQLQILAGYYTWPADAKDADPIGDLDNGFTEQRELRPYYFSSF